MTTITLSDGRTIEVRPLTIATARRIRSRCATKLRRGIAIVQVVTGLPRAAVLALPESDMLAIEASIVTDDGKFLKLVV